MANIVIIGAGSLVFSSRLTADILTYPELADSTFTLLDTDPDRLAYAEKIVRRIFLEGKYDKASVRSETDRRKALEGADFVIISILVGGNRAIESEIDIPKRYGIDQCIGDTLTPGGIMRCLRTLPVMEEMARDIASICPNAYVLNYTNPMGMLSWGFTDAAPDLAYVGLCHSVQGTGDEWANRLNIPFEDVNFLCAGINHQAWFLKYEYQGVDQLPKIRELALNPDIWYGDSTRMEYVKHFSYPVTESSGHVSEYSWWFRKDEDTVTRYCPASHSEWNGGHGFIKKLYDRPDWKQQMQDMADWKHPIDLKRSHEYGSQIINAVWTDTNQVIYGNVKNNGFIDNLPKDSVVEVPCLVNKNGIMPLSIGKLPPHLAAINNSQLAVQELAVRAVQQQDPELVFQAMAMDPLTAMSCTLDQIREMTRELMQAHREFIPVMGDKLPEEKPLVYLQEPTGPVEKHIDPAAVNNEAADK